MSSNVETVVNEVCDRYGNDRTRMMDIVRDVQQEMTCVSDEALEAIAARVGTHRVEVESVVSFYAFLSEKPKGKTVIRLCNDIIDRMSGADEVAEAMAKELGIAVGETTADGRISLEHTPCIGMCDQAPAALVNDVIVTNLDAAKAAVVAKAVKEKGADADFGSELGDGNNADELVRSMVQNNIRQKGEVVLADFEKGAALNKALAMTPMEVIRDVKTSRLRGRGGAGFPTGMKWEFTRKAESAKRYVLCNADEGEPGTFKDRVILTECPELVFEGMAIAGYAIGADAGVIYLRAEYAYLRAFLEDRLNKQREAGLLGNNIKGTKDFNFDIRIQMGAGAYICGEETSLISSCEGSRGDPKNRPPFPAQKGYLGQPTTVNNVETFCCVARILDKGPGWFAQIGSKDSPGTKVLSISGDCENPGVYEVPFGISVKDMLKMAGAENAQALQIGGPSGTMIGPADYERVISYEDLATGGSVMVFGPQRDVLEVVQSFMEFFVDESCGYCTPCRVGNTLLKNKLEEIMAGNGEPDDIQYLTALANTVKTASRCGLGQTSPNPILTSVERFMPAYEALMTETEEGDVFKHSFDIQGALATSKDLIGRKSEIFN